MQKTTGEKSFMEVKEANKDIKEDLKIDTNLDGQTKHLNLSTQNLVNDKATNNTSSENLADNITKMQPKSSFKKRNK
jgi:hypothetical protein